MVSGHNQITDRFQSDIKSTRFIKVSTVVTMNDCTIETVSHRKTCNKSQVTLRPPLSQGRRDQGGKFKKVLFLHDISEINEARAII